MKYEVLVLGLKFVKPLFFPEAASVTLLAYLVLLCQVVFPSPR